jgi:hypothetical protein
LDYLKRSFLDGTFSISNSDDITSCPLGSITILAPHSLKMEIKMEQPLWSLVWLGDVGSHRGKSVFI